MSESPLGGPCWSLGELQRTVAWALLSSEGSAPLWKEPGVGQLERCFFPSSGTAASAQMEQSHRSHNPQRYCSKQFVLFLLPVHLSVEKTSLLFPKRGKNDPGEPVAWNTPNSPHNAMFGGRSSSCFVRNKMSGRDGYLGLHFQDVV